MAHRRALLYDARPVRIPSSIVLAASLACALAAGCSPRIGDACAVATNCSINNDRLCDPSQPNGACIVFDCQADRCPDDAVCVRFNPDPPRRQVVACMRRCSGDGDCRSADGYRCVSDGDLESMGLTADVIDVTRPDARYCVAVD